LSYKCYCCGEPLGDAFVLVSYDKEVDRVFLMKPEHADRADELTIRQLVKRVRP
jgi:hypothetical protein